MNFASMDLNLLRALQALLEEESVGRAARRMHLSQPAMSHALRRLRNILGDELLVRVGTRMQLTARAESLRDPLRDLFDRMREVLVNSEFDPTVSRRTFHLFIADNAVDLLLPAVLARIAKKAPGVCINVQSWRPRADDPAELARSLDAAIACVPESFPGFHRNRLFTDRDMCVFRSRHPAAENLADGMVFFETGHVAVTVRGAAEDPVDTWLKGEGRKRNIVVTVPHYLQALHIVARSDLIAVIPEQLIRAYAVTLHLKGCRLPLDAGTFEEFLLHPPRTHADPGCIWFRGVLQDVAKTLD
jgi:DNA-binding transcriptional LysR family regulator